MANSRDSTAPPGAAASLSEPAETGQQAALVLDAAEAVSQVTGFPELEDRRAVACDRELPVDERLEAYEDIFDSEVGDTTMVRARHVEREFGLRQLFLKFEGSNPTGTQKDRIAFAQVADALRRGFDTVAVATCGNYGAAVALAASMAGLRCEIFIPESFHGNRVVEMEKLGAVILRTAGDYEAAVRASQEEADRKGLYDANPGGANTPLQLQAYGEIALEIYDELRDAPAMVAVSVSNGTTLAGIHKGFLRLFRRGKTYRVPRMVAGSSSRKNPIVRSWLKNLPACEDLDPARIRETPVNEPLINWHSFDGDVALQAVRDSGGWGAFASDRNMLQNARMLLEKEGLSALPASCAALAVMLERHRQDPLPADRYVVVLTGKR